MNRFKLLFAILLTMLLINGLVFAQDTTLTVTSAGKVGIGTTSPQAPLEVRYSNANRNWGVPVLILDNPAGGTRTALDFSINGSSVAYFNATNQGMIKLNRDGAFQIANLANTRNDLIVDVSGKVGIGTTNPTQKLHVTDSAVGNFVANIENTATTNSLGLGIETNSSDNSAAFRIRSAGIITFYVTNTGDVGIGTTNPQGKLDVNGSIYQRGSLLHADYVFEPDYKLESIEDHAKFMWKNKHLKAIPKAKVDENGLEIVEVGAHRKGIVEELEKAHIYIDQLHNRIKTLETALEKLAIRLDGNN